MALVLKDRVKESTTTTGTGAVTLDGASTGFQAFDAVGNFNQTYYTITDGVDWEVGVGTFGELESSAALSLAFDETTTLDARITFTRATNGTYFDSAGVLQTASSGVARFDHRLENGVWVNKGLLIEEARTNISQRSEEMNNAFWQKTQVTVTADNTASPDGTTNADAVFETTVNNFHFISTDNITINATSTSFTVSTFVKANGRTRGQLKLAYKTGGFQEVSAGFNLSTGTITFTFASAGGLVQGSSITDVGNGWYRVSVSGFTGQSGFHGLQLFLLDDAGASSYAGDITKGMFMWGAQLEAGAFPTSYIATTSASVTRNADVASMTSTNFSDWYNATEGTVFCQFNFNGLTLPGTSAQILWNISDGTAGERMQLNTITDDPVNLSYFLFRDGGSNFDISSPDPRKQAFINTTYKSCSAYKLNNNATSLDGVSPTTLNTVTMPTVDRLNIGANQLVEGQTNGHIAKFYYWNTRLPNATLQYLSSSFGSPTVSRRLNRDEILASSNSNALVNWGAGEKAVFSPLPAIATQGSAATADNSSIGTDLYAWSNFKKLLDKSVVGGVAYGNNGTNGIVSTYSLLITGSSFYLGAVLAPNGDVHFVPRNTSGGQKLSASGVVSTYSLVYTNSSNSYFGGVLAPNGDIHFVPFSAPVGQKINASGVVSTYSLVYTTATSYYGGVLAPNGDIHFVPSRAVVGQKISAAGVVSTYSLIYTLGTTNSAYGGGVLAPNGDVHFIPLAAAVGQKISAAGVVSTYSLVYTTSSGAYYGGVLAPNGDIHFVPQNASVGQKISVAGVVSTYSLPYTTSFAYSGGVLAPNGDIHFVPSVAAVGQKINTTTGIVSTYSLIYTTASGSYFGGVLRPDGSIVFTPNNAPVGQIISTNPGIALGQEACLSSYLNKF